MNDELFRPLNVNELNVLNTLLTADFQGAKELKQQLADSQARLLDSEGSIEIKVGNPILAMVQNSVPVEASYFDGEDRRENDPRVRVLVHVRDGLLKELEFYKDDGTKIRRWPRADELSIEINHAV